VTTSPADSGAIRANAASLRSMCPDAQGGHWNLVIHQDIVTSGAGPSGNSG
jgi:hypothetical protein